MNDQLPIINNSYIQARNQSVLPEEPKKLDWRKFKKFNPGQIQQGKPVVSLTEFMKSPEVKNSSINFMGGQSSYMDEMKKMATKLYGKVEERLGGKAFTVGATSAAAEAPAEVAVGYNVPKRQISKAIATVIAEAATEGNEGMQAVLNTMNNRMRVNPNYYGKNIFDVISKEAQYSAFNVKDPNYKEVLDYYDGKIKKLSPLRMSQVLAVEGMIQLAKQNKLDDITGGATHYWNPEKAAQYSWMGQIQNPKKIGNHMFGYLYQ